MSEPDTLPTGVHPEAAQLPWYANNTLKQAEQELVFEHLKTCDICRRELDELTHLRAQLTALYEAEAKPSPRTAQSILQKIAQEASSQKQIRSSRQNWLDRFDSWVRTLLTPRLAPTLAMLALVAQSGLLIWATIPPTPSEQITSRSVGSSSVRFSVVFHEQATEEEIRSLLNTVRGRVIDGPTVKGAYVLEVLAADQETHQKKLEMLRRSQPNVIQSVEPAEH
jgi:anti-sigma factor RsiW